MKPCIKCGSVRRSTSPSRKGIGCCLDCAGARASRYYQQNKIKVNAYQTQWEKNNPRKIRSYSLKSKYGITIEDYDALFESQNGKCAICKGPSTRTNFDVDHCHDTGRVRGLLCNRCNVLIGLVGSDFHILTTVIEYLEKN